VASAYEQLAAAGLKRQKIAYPTKSGLSRENRTHIDSSPRISATCKQSAIASITTRPGNHLITTTDITLIRTTITTIKASLLIITIMKLIIFVVVPIAIIIATVRLVMLDSPNYIACLGDPSNLHFNRLSRQIFHMDRSQSEFVKLLEPILMHVSSQ
jgi:hypothetical protein